MRFELFEFATKLNSSFSSIFKLHEIEFVNSGHFQIETKIELEYFVLNNINGDAKHETETQSTNGDAKHKRRLTVQTETQNTNGYHSTNADSQHKEIQYIE